MKGGPLGTDGPKVHVRQADPDPLLRDWDGTAGSSTGGDGNPNGVVGGVCIGAGGAGQANPAQAMGAPGGSSEGFYKRKAELLRELEQSKMEALQREVDQLEGHNKRLTSRVDKLEAQLQSEREHGAHARRALREMANLL